MSVEKKNKEMFVGWMQLILPTLCCFEGQTRSRRHKNGSAFPFHIFPVDPHTQGGPPYVHASISIVFLSSSTETFTSKWSYGIIRYSSASILSCVYILLAFQCTGILPFSSSQVQKVRKGFPGRQNGIRKGWRPSVILPWGRPTTVWLLAVYVTLTALPSY